MSEAIEFTEVDEKNVVFDGARKVYLVSLGATTYAVTNTTDYAKKARTNLGDLTNKMLEQGQETEKKTRKAVSKQSDTRRKDLDKTVKRIEKEFGKRMESLLHAMNIPSQNDIKTLNNKVTRLNKKVEELSKTS